MAFTNSQLDADVLVMIDDLPLAVTFGAETENGTRSQLRKDAVFADEGLRGAYQFSVYIRLTDWTNPPGTNNVVTINSADWLVLDFENGNGDRVRRLDLAEEHAP